MRTVTQEYVNMQNTFNSLSDKEKVEFLNNMLDIMNKQGKIKQFNLVELK